MIQICFTSRLSSLPLVVAYQKGYFDEFDTKVSLHQNTHHKSTLSLLDAGRVEAGEIPTIVFLQEFFLKKSKVKRIYKGLPLYNSPLSFYSRFQFKPEDLSKNKAYMIPVPHTLSVERFFAEKFLEEYAPKNPVKLRFIETAGFLEEKEFLRPNCLGLVSDPFLSPFLKNFQDFRESEEFPILKEIQYFPSTMLAFSGDAVLNMGREVSGVLLSVKKAIDYLHEQSNKSSLELWEELHLNQYYPHLRIGESKNIFTKTQFHLKKIFSYESNAKLLHPLLKDVYFRLIRRIIPNESIDHVLHFGEILDSLKAKRVFDVKKLESFQEPNEIKLHAPTQINYRKLNAVRHLIVDVNSVMLDILHGNFSSRLNTDETLQLDNRVKVLVNTMLDTFAAQYELLRQERNELENLISILEIKLDRSAVDLQYSEEKYRYLFEFANEAIALVDAESGAILEANNQFRSLTGYTRTDITKMNIEDLILGNRVSEQLQFGTASSQEMMLSLPDVEVLLKDGRKLEVDISFTSILLSPKKRYQVQFRFNKERKEQERLQHEFISNVSHELRSPMTNIRGYLEFLKSDPNINFNSEHKNMLEVIEKNAKRLSFLIENMLKLTTSREKDKEDEVVEIFDPALVIDDVIHMNSHLTKGKSLDWEIQIPKGHLIKGIRFEFSQIITNLYVNALKYTMSGKIGIYLSEVAGKIEIKISDTGIGIDPNFKNQIFDRFFRIPSSDNRKIGGTGLGLSIVKSLVEKMEGDIQVESELGKGSVFIISFPKIKNVS